MQTELSGNKIGKKKKANSGFFFFSLCLSLPLSSFFSSPLSPKKRAQSFFVFGAFAAPG